jgi:hypothetical protein
LIYNQSVGESEKRPLSYVMNKSKFLALATIFINITLSSPGQDYEYQFTAPITGQFQQGAWDLSYGQGIGQLFYFGTLTETVYYNPTANTLDQIGSFTLSATEFSGSFQDNKVISGSVIPATVSVVYILNGGNSTVSFNSGFLSVGANPAMDWSIPFTESITVTTGGQNYSDILSGSIPEGNTITSISQFTPESIVLSQGYNSDYAQIFDSSDVDIVSASDGWFGDIFDGVDDGSLIETYNVGPVTANAVPEPGSWTMFSLGGFGLMIAFRRRIH